MRYYTDTVAFYLLIWMSLEYLSVSPFISASIYGSLYKSCVVVSIDIDYSEQDQGPNLHHIDHGQTRNQSPFNRQSLNANDVNGENHGENGVNTDNNHNLSSTLSRTASMLIRSVPVFGSGSRHDLDNIVITDNIKEDGILYLSLSISSCLFINKALGVGLSLLFSVNE